MAITSSYIIRTKKARRQRRSGAPNWLLVLAEVLVPLLILGWWWLASANSTNTFFPPLQEILSRLWELVFTTVFWVNAGSSVGNLVLSIVLAWLIGVGLGTALGLSQTLSWGVEPVVHFFRAIPPVALVPLFVSLIGFGNETRVVSITISALFPVLISTIDGVRGVTPTLRMVASVYRIPWRERIFSVTMPAASPRIFAGMQVSLIAAFVVMIASEMLGSSTGLGAATLLAQQSFAIADMWAGIIVLGIIGYAVTALFAVFRRRTLRWYIALQQQEKNG